MIVLAGRNRFVLAPRLADHPLDTAAAIRRAVLAEIALGMAAIALVATFGLMDPAYPG